jgi:hypothetical protein
MVMAAVDDEPMQGKENLASKVLCVQESPTTSQLTTTAPVSTCNFCLFLEKADYKNVSHFCNWASTTSDSANLKLLWTHAIDEGKKLGIEEGRILWYKEFYGEGYAPGCSDTLQDELAFKEFRSEGFGEGLSIRFKNGELAGREAERATRDHRNNVHTNCSTQTTTSTTCTIDAVTQTASQNVPLHLLRDTGTSTETSSLSQMTPSPTLPIPLPSPPPTMSQPMMPTQPVTATSWLPTPSTTAITCYLPPSK